MPIEESELYKTIRNVFIASHYGLTPARFTMKPAWKYAYYNAAKKNANGQVVFKEIMVGLYIILALLSLAVVVSLIAKFYPATFAAVVLLTALLVSWRFVPAKTLVFDSEGFAIADVQYRWSDYDGVYMAVMLHDRSRETNLVMIKNGQPAAYINVSGFGDMCKIASGVRDFQPERYKDLL
ncbi:hypothetical protein [Chitinophaga sp. Cy-1792]|uniref:hypothetical protein n=1 Tax=Chitinophaga sp. Cy-1792 TaxID=2608339 RepID=UPI001421BF06|nr:hypothetical protein [Chitinophaga sp. Cy-1792]NIG55645.1 hypothetical protein [Chitinophaga sp. Cy-1792]